MADISKIKPNGNNGNEYALKDSYARSKIEINTVKCNKFVSRDEFEPVIQLLSPFFLISGLDIWTDGDDIYYSYGKDNQYILDKTTSAWLIKDWNGNRSFEGRRIWTDGENIYYSYGSDQYILDKTTSTWSKKTWNGLTSFSGGNIWTDGDNIYYSNGSNQYILDKSTSTWSEKIWNGLTIFFGVDIWTDDVNVYYSSNSSQYILDKTTATWSEKIWNGLTNFYGSGIWIDENNIYYSINSDQYVLDKFTSTWFTKTWSGLANFDGSRIWANGDNIYYSAENEQYILDKIADEWINKTWSREFVAVRKNIWTDGKNFYYSYGNNQYILDKTTSTWLAKDWTGLTNFNGEYIWTDGDYIYYSYEDNQYLLNPITSTWSSRIWLGVAGFYGGNYIWTDGDNIYYSYGSNQYILDKSMLPTWSTKIWGNLTNFDGVYIWTDGENIYYSHANEQYVLNKATSVWSTKSWTGLTNFEGNKIWTDGDSIYYNSNSGDSYILNKTTSTWSTKSWRTAWTGFTVFSGDDVWTDGEYMYCPRYKKQYVLNKTINSMPEMMSSTITIDNIPRSTVEGAIGAVNVLANNNKANINELNSEKQSKVLSSTITVDGTSQTTVEGAIGAINNYCDTQESKISEIYAVTGLYGTDVYGLQVDFENYIYTRLAGAVGKTAGTDFNTIAPWSGMKRCNLTDDGTVNAYYGENNYIEDGSNGQVMVEIPKFYYRVVPLKTEPIGDSVGGKHLRKANYYISATKYEGFKTHPLFVKPDGTERDKAYVSAYEGCVYDVSESAYILDDAQTADFTVTTGDKLSSIANAKPCSGFTQNLTRANSEILAKNRGTGWHCADVKAMSAEQLLFMIEYGTLNSQNAIGKGVVKNESGTGNNAEITGATSSLGNSTGMASGTNGFVSVSCRGVENPYGNIWKFIEGLTLWGDGTLRGGQPYICDDYAFVEDTKTDHTATKFTVTNTNGYISAFGYDPDFDWLFLPSECLNADSNYPVGDYVFVTSNLDGYRISLIGANWNDNVQAGMFCWNLRNETGISHRIINVRLMYIS